MLAQAELGAANLDGPANDAAVAGRPKRRHYDNAVLAVRRRATDCPHDVLDECVVRLFSYTMRNYAWQGPPMGRSSNGWNETGCGALVKDHQRKHALVAGTGGTPTITEPEPDDEPEPEPEPAPPPELVSHVLTGGRPSAVPGAGMGQGPSQRRDGADPGQTSSAPAHRPAPSEVHVAWAVPDDGPDPAQVHSIPDIGGNFQTIDPAVIPAFIPPDETIPYKGWYHNVPLSPVVADILTAYTIVMELE